MSISMKKLKKIYQFQILYRPGLNLEDDELDFLTAKLREAADTCFDTVPEYQALTGKREELQNNVISVAWRGNKIAGFVSTVILTVKGVGNVLHLGLTCVRPEDRSNGLTHVLNSKAVTAYLLRNRPLIGKVWVSNCAAVLSSLVNVSLCFERVYPSPSERIVRTKQHDRIAEAIDRYYRNKIYINPDAKFDPQRYIFKGSVKNTMFQKESDDSRFYHRNHELNEFYRSRMRFDEGDEVLQVGYASTFAAVKYMTTKFVNFNPKKVFAKMTRQTAGMQG